MTEQEQKDFERLREMAKEFEALRPKPQDMTINWTYPPQPTSPCPSCGFCPSCGRRNQPYKVFYSGANSSITY